MKVLVTGATGSLGTPLLPALVAGGHEIRAFSRKERSAPGVEWVRGDLSTGEGIASAVEGVDVILHAATHGGYEGGKMRITRAFLHSGKTDVDGTARIVEAAKRAGTQQIVFTSIVGTDKVPVSYYKHKAQAEEVIRSGGVPFTIARITQFHALMDGLISYATRFPVAMMPLRSQYQSIDEREAAALVAPLVAREPADETLEFGGPETLTLVRMAEIWSAARGISKKFLNMPMPGSKAQEQGLLCTQDRSGTTTWEQWLKEKSS